MRGMCSDGPAQGWMCDNLPKLAPSALLVPCDIEDYLPGAEPETVQPGTEFPTMAGNYSYRLDRMDVVYHATLPGATEAAAFYVYDPSLDEHKGHMPSMGDWRYIL